MQVQRNINVLSWFLPKLEKNIINNVFQGTLNAYDIVIAGSNKKGHIYELKHAVKKLENHDLSVMC